MTGQSIADLLIKSVHDLGEAQAVVPTEWHQELERQQDLYDRVGARMPKELVYERELLRARLG